MLPRLGSGQLSQNAAIRIVRESKVMHRSPVLRRALACAGTATVDRYFQELPALFGPLPPQEPLPTLLLAGKWHRRAGHLERPCVVVLGSPARARNGLIKERQDALLRQRNFGAN